MKNALLESVEGENDGRNDFMINLHETYVAELGCELVTLDLQLGALLTLYAGWKFQQTTYWVFFFFFFFVFCFQETIFFPFFFLHEMTLTVSKAKNKWKVMTIKMLTAAHYVKWSSHYFGLWDPLSIITNKLILPKNT